MNFTVFYSWQSDIESKYNRSLIEDALKKAVKKITDNEDLELEAVIDRDTYGMPGSPSIVESITSKIAKSDVFVCDVSIINATSDARKMPNPNVLFELGYASAILGWDRIIMVQNTAFGGPDMLPFDLRGRRILQYEVNSSIENKGSEKQKLKDKLVGTFHHALQHYSGWYNSKEKMIWWGTWGMESRVKIRGGQLHISRVSSDAFFFNISIFDGARSGYVSGKAQILTPHAAYARVKSFDKKNCEIAFKRRLEGDSWIIEVEEGADCSGFHGMSATFTGTYKHSPELIVNRGYLDEIDLNEIERLTGKYISVFLDNFQQINLNDEVNEGDLTIITAGVKGLYTIMESIVVLDKSGSVWCACLDPNADYVRYFTNSLDKSKPKAMEEWLDRFSDRHIMINDTGSSISNDDVNV